MIKWIQISFVFIVVYIHGQNADVRKFDFNYKNTTVEYIVLSKIGEKEKKKPLFIFCQGSLAQPIAKMTGQGMLPLFPFNEEILLKDFHVVYISKPGIPLKVNIAELKPDYSFPKNGNPPIEYIKNNNLNYYYRRNNIIINQLIKKNWVDRSKVVVAGHSEGSYIALEMAKSNSLITHLIYSGGNPLGRIMSIINSDRMNRAEEEGFVQEDLNFWQKVVKNKTVQDYSTENTFNYHYSLSRNFIPDLLNLKIPILVTYGTKDQNGIFNDYLHVLTIKKNKYNFTFKSYFHTDHNFFPIDEEGMPNYNVDNWTKVAHDWINWYKNN